MPLKRMEPIKLTKEMRDTLTEMEPDLMVLELEIAKAKRAKIDITDLEKRFKEMKELRMGLLREYV